MRTVFLGIVAAAGFGLAGVSATLAAPVNGSAITGQAVTESLVVDVKHCRWSRHRRYCGYHSTRASRHR